MRSIITKLLMSIAMICFSFTASAYDYEVFTVNDISYSILSENDGICEVIKGGGVDVEIPSTVKYDGRQYVVTRIGDYAFMENLESNLLKSVVIPESVTEIGNGAFEYCRSLVDVTLPTSIAKIGEVAFYNCSSLTSIVIPNSVTVIGTSTFENCGSLTSVTISDSVTKIGSRAFQACSSLTSVTIPESATEIGSYAFFGCSSLISVSIPNSVSSIGKYALSGCSFTSVNIPNSLTEISDGTFSGCKFLTSVTIPDAVTKIGESAFSNCSALSSVTIPDEVTIINRYVFNNCSSLTSVTIGHSVSRIAQYAFGSCSALTSVTIPDSTTEIEEYAFFDCSSLTNVVIGDSVSVIGDLAFVKCPSLMEISVADDNKYFSSVDGVLFNKDCSKLIAFPNSKCTEYAIPNTVNNIWRGAFDSCCSLKSVIIPESVTIIGEIAFFGYGGSSLSSITISDSVKEIGGFAFSQCDKLTSFYYNCVNPIEIDDDSIFKGSLEDATLFVPAAAVEKCKLIRPWKDFKNIVAYDFAGVDSVNLNEGKTIKGRFDINGIPVDENYKGLIIVRFTDGTIKKIIK